MMASRNIGLRALQQKRTIFGWLSQNKMIYPPSPSQISTKNRLFPTYIDHPTELGTIVLDKDPLILNFTIPGDKKCNEVTQALYDILGDSKRYPFDGAKPVSMASIACDSPGGKELQLQYVVNNIPTLVLLKKQMVMDSYVPKPGPDVHKEVMKFVKSIY
ncbi:hypothetical protein PUMCH_001859 [Australozyma saopauloensis]|uniref:Thioredoxin domain-containing protein n=1 Tax=Australozyma saopauloensis TaxID=291208 RepID=A0AAX4H7M4_9ASCO|nr:hypothetical protein PUMCH_001859 [[Candida] saopauloensis]